VKTFNSPLRQPNEPRHPARQRPYLAALTAAGRDMTADDAQKPATSPWGGCDEARQEPCGASGLAS
jgi:hypothetical protein